MFLRPRNFRLLRIKNSIFLDGHASLSNVSNHLQYTNPLTDKPDWIPFNQAKYGEFNQEEPVLGNQFTEDALLQRYLKRNIPSEVCYLHFVVYSNLTYTVLFLGVFGNGTRLKNFWAQSCIKYL